MNEIIKIIFVLLIVEYLGLVINYAMNLWQAFPIKEIPERPFYITKVITNDVYSE